MWAFEMLKFDHFWLIAIALLGVCGGDNCFQQYNFLARSCTFPAPRLLWPGGNWNPSFSWIFFLIFQRTSHPMIVHSLLWSRAHTRNYSSQKSQKGKTIGKNTLVCHCQMRYSSGTKLPSAELHLILWLHDWCPFLPSSTYHVHIVWK